MLLAGGFLVAPGALHSQTGLLVVAHGGGTEWNAGVRAVVEQVRWPAGPIVLAFLMGPDATSQGWEAGLAKLLSEGAREAIVVPLLVSSHGGHYHQIRFFAGELSELPAELLAHGHAAGHTPPPLPLRVTAALDAAPELGEAVAARWRELDSLDRRRPVVLVAHGPGSDAEAEQWHANLDAAAAVIRRAANQPVAIGLLRDDAPAPVRAAAIAALRTTVLGLADAARDSVAVLPVLISSGAINRVTIPKDLQGLPIRYHPVALAPHPALARWIERVALGEAAAPR